jgi:DNA-binding MarR family transcriptional regulator
MSTTLLEPQRTQAVQDLFEVLIRFSRSLRARGADWGQAVRDLTRADIVTLGVLETRGSLRPSRIAAALAVDPSVVSRQLAGLDRLGLVARGTDPDDGRAELITITPEGRERLVEVRTAMCASLAERLDHWDLEDITTATAMVDDLADRLHQPVTATRKEDHV